MLLRDKVALVTGASRGIGKAIAETFAANGASLLLVARSAGIADVAAALKGAEGRIEAFQGDVTDEATLRDCVKRCRAEFGRIDVLVNNAGAMSQAVIGMIPAAQVRETFELNVHAMIQLTQYASRAMKAPASIINLSSIARRGLVGASVYSAAKSAVVGFTLAAAKELGPRGIRVNALAPGFIDTDLTRQTPDDVRRRTLDGIRLGRIGQPQDVANAALFLACDLSSYVTGQVLGVDGGMTV